MTWSSYFIRVWRPSGMSQVGHLMFKLPCEFVACPSVEMKRTSRGMDLAQLRLHKAIYKWTPRGRQWVNDQVGDD